HGVRMALDADVVDVGHRGAAAVGDQAGLVRELQGVDLGVVVLALHYRRGEGEAAVARHADAVARVLQDGAAVEAGDGAGEGVGDGGLALAAVVVAGPATAATATAATAASAGGEERNGAGQREGRGNGMRLANHRRSLQSLFRSTGVVAPMQAPVMVIAKPVADLVLLLSRTFLASVPRAGMHKVMEARRPAGRGRELVHERT